MEIRLVVPQTTPTPEPSTYIFSPRELQRLAAYRAAVIARFYNDDSDTLPTAQRFPTAKSGSLRRAAGR
jgi:hypothetical protein